MTDTAVTGESTDAMAGTIDHACETVGDFDERGLVIIRAGTVWESGAMSDQHLARALTRYTNVLYVDPTISPTWRLRDPTVKDRLDAGRLQQMQSGLYRLIPPSMIAPRRRGVVALSDLLLGNAVRRAVRRIGIPVRAIISVEATPRFDEEDAPMRVFWATDDYVAGADLMGQSRRRRKRLDVRMVQDADLTVTVSEELTRRWSSVRDDIVTIPNGVDVQAFARVDDSPAKDVTLPGPIAGVVGTIGSRIDFDVLQTIADRGISLLLVGALQLTFDRGPLDRLLRRPNVQWTGYRPFESLPSYLAHIDVGLTPYTDDAFNRASFPLKTLEYLAAGRRVVSTDLPASRWLGTDLIRTAGSPHEFADAVESELLRPTVPEEAGVRRAFATRHSWDRRGTEWADLLGLVKPTSLDSILGSAPVPTAHGQASATNPSTPSTT